MPNFVRCLFQNKRTNFYWNRFIFDRQRAKNKLAHFWDTVYRPIWVYGTIWMMAYLLMISVMVCIQYTHCTLLWYIVILCLSLLQICCCANTVCCNACCSLNWWNVLMEVVALQTSPVASRVSVNSKIDYHINHIGLRTTVWPGFAPSDPPYCNSRNSR